MLRRRQRITLATMMVAGFLFMIYAFSLLTHDSISFGILISLCGLALIGSSIWGLARLHKMK